MTGAAYRDHFIELYWLEHLFLPYMKIQLENDKIKCSKLSHQDEVILPSV